MTKREKWFSDLQKRRDKEIDKGLKRVKRLQMKQESINEQCEKEIRKTIKKYKIEEWFGGGVI